MATLNVKDFPDNLYEELRNMAKEDQRSIAQEVVYLLSHAVREKPRRSLRMLKGLGKDLWHDIDASSHIKRERDAWDS